MEPAVSIRRAGMYLVGTDSRKPFVVTLCVEDIGPDADLDYSSLPLSLYSFKEVM